jgi:hypothetical protein
MARLFAHGEAAITVAYLITRASRMGSIAQNPEMMREPVNEAVSGGFAVLCDVIPDVERIAARPAGEAETPSDRPVITARLALQLVCQSGKRLVRIVGIMPG